MTAAPPICAGEQILVPTHVAPSGQHPSCPGQRVYPLLYLVSTYLLRILLSACACDLNGAAGASNTFSP